jgi:hypothetical protein
MTPVSQHYLGLICKYCIHCHDGGCFKDVPWYAVTLECNFFEDGKPVVHCRPSDFQVKLVWEDEDGRIDG